MSPFGPDFATYLRMSVAVFSLHLETSMTVAPYLFLRLFEHIINSEFDVINYLLKALVTLAVASQSCL